MVEILRWVAALSLLIPLVVHAYLGSLSRFIADDYCAAAMVRIHGVWGATGQLYQTWSGRFSANFLDSFVTFLGPQAASLLPGLFLLAWLSFLVWVAYRLFSKTALRGSLLVAVAFSTLLLVSVLQLTPQVNQSLYWGAGMRSVVSPLVVSAAHCGVILCIWHGLCSNRMAVLWVALCGVMAFLAGGFSETFAALQTTIFVIALVFGWIAFPKESRHTVNRVFGTGVLASLAALAVTVAAPGNFFRQQHFPPPPDVVDLVVITLFSFAGFFETLLVSRLNLLNLGLVFGIALFAGAGILWNQRSEKGSRRPDGLSLLWIPAVLLVLLLACFAPAAYGMSGAPPKRTAIIPVFLLVLGVLFWGFQLGAFAYYKWRSERWLSARMTVLAEAGALFVLAVFALGISIQLLQQRSVFVEYATWWDQSDETIRTASLVGKVYVTVPTPPTSWSGLEEFGPDPAYWTNNCVGNYYDIRVSTEAP